MAGTASEGWFRDEPFREIADAAPVSLWRIDASFKHDWVNKHWLDFTGGRLEEEVAFAWVDKVHPDDRERVLEEFDRAFDAREPTAVEFRLQGKDGRYRWFHDSGTPYYRDGEFAGFVGSCLDVTERKQAERHLEILRAKLIERSGAEAAGMLAASIAHGVSQPLLAIGAHAGDLERLIAGRQDLPADFAAAVAAIRSAVDRGQEIAGNCRDVLANGTAERRREDVAAVLRSTEDLIRAHPAAGAALVWEMEPDLQACLSAAQIRQVLLALAVNGLQAMEGMVDPVLAISAARWGRTAVVSVADRGPGVAPAAREHLFKASVSAKSGGMGLGLYLSRLIVAAHHGRIWFEDNADGGAAFRFTLPLVVLEQS